LSGIYLHIPFCKQACTYCDFYFSTSLTNKDAVVGAILRELEVRSSYLADKNISSIYFGGGTPSLLSKADLERILGEIGKRFNWDKDAEITLEANPDDITVEVLRDWKTSGINRLSIGLQSFNDAELKWMNRAHTAAESVSSVKMAQDAGFENITIDLIYGSKFQTVSSWENTLQTAIGLNTQHISSYNLTIEKKTVLGINQAKGKEPEVDDELSSRQFLIMLDTLRSAGFIQYEISNFGKEGFFAKHNSNYWLQHPYLGIGPSAHSFNGTSRQWNVRNNVLYVKTLNDGSSFFEKEELSPQDRYNEYVLTRLRTIWGCDLNEIKALFGEETAQHFIAGINSKRNFVEEKNGIYTLNQEGKLQADGIASDLFI
jgi:oxygen-independent coproporphyrinogen-3 oxidase